jgi:CSLREA domain-containing protein
MPASKRVRLRTPLLSIPLALVASLLWAVAAQAATFTVTKAADTADGSCDAADCSLREAISAANATAEADTVVVPAGTYMLSLAGAGEDLNASGDLDVTQPVTISGAGAATTIIDGNGSVVMERVLDVVSATADTTLTGVTIQNGDSTPDGGGIRAAAPLTLTNAAVSQNASDTGGGGIQSDATVTLTNVTVSDNASGTGGGGISSSGSVTLSDTVVEGNSSGAGGGGIAASAGLSLTDVAVTGNTASTGGGGISASADLTLTNVTVNGNSAGSGGGGITASALLTLTNVTISGNTADTGGGGITAGAGGTLNNVTITANTADDDGNGTGDGGGISLGVAVSLANTLVARNADDSPGVQAPDCAGPVTSQGYNLIGIGDPPCVFTASTGDLVGTAASPIDPLLGPLADNGGPTDTHALLPGSPAIDAGNPATPGSGFPACALTDQRGFFRLSRCDIGAYEAGGSPTPPPSLSPGPGPQAGIGAGVIKCLKRPATIVGTDGKDVLVGTKGKDVIAGLGKKDRIRGRGGRDRICGGRGNDVLRGAGGNDRLNGQKGRRDLCIGGPGRDRGRCERERSIP